MLNTFKLMLYFWIKKKSVILKGSEIWMFTFLLLARICKSPRATSARVLSTRFCDRESIRSRIWEWNVQDFNCSSIKCYTKQIIDHRAEQAYRFSPKLCLLLFFSSMELWILETYKTTSFCYSMHNK